MSSPLRRLRSTGVASLLAVGIAAPALAAPCPPPAAPARMVTVAPGSRVVLAAAPGSVILLSGSDPVRVTALPADAATRLPGRRMPGLRMPSLRMPSLRMIADMQRMMLRMTRQVNALFAAPLGPFGPGGLWRASFGPGVLAPLGGPGLLSVSTATNGVRSCAESVSYRIGPNGTPIVHVVRTGNACGQIRLLGPGMTPAAQPVAPAARPAAPGVRPAASAALGPRLIPAVYRATAPAPAH